MVRDDMLMLQHWSGPIDVREISDFPGGVDEVIAYVENNQETFKTGAVFIDPFDRLVESISDSETTNKYDATTQIITKCLDWTKSFKGGEGLMLFVSCQLNRAFAPELAEIWKKDSENLDAYERGLKAAKLHYFSNLKMRSDVGIAIASTRDRALKVVACHRARHSNFFDTFHARIDGKSLAMSAVGADATPLQAVIAKARVKLPQTPEEKLAQAQMRVNRMANNIKIPEGVM
jgi:hypothetical protein